MEFKTFPEVERFGKAGITVTQKIHGTNAQILIYQKDDGTLDLMTGSRTRWIAPGSDNFGFAQYVYNNKQEFIDKLGVGRWYGEWAGPGINSGEGLKEKTFLLFDVLRIDGRPLPAGTTTVPLLYQGAFDQEKINAVYEDLKTNGSKLVPGYTRPEGVVIHLLGTPIRYKRVFTPEETAWTKPSGVKAPRVDGPKVDHLLQPIRLEKLLSRDQMYITGYPVTIATICRDYTEDLVKEGQITGTEAEIKGLKKSLGSQLFPFVKSFIGEKYGL